MITLVQQAHHALLSGTGSVTLGSTPTPGNLLVLTIESISTRAGPPTSPVWTAVATNSPCSMYYRFAGASEPTVITANAAESDTSMDVFEFAGYTGSNFASTGITFGTNSGSGTGASTGLITPATNNAAIVAVVANQTANFSGPSVAAPFTGTSADGSAEWLGYTIVSAATPIGATFSWSNSMNWWSIIAAFPGPATAVAINTGRNIPLSRRRRMR